MKARINAAVSSGRSSWGTWPQPSRIDHLRAGDRVREPPRVVHRDPAVLAAPHHERRRAHAADLLDDAARDAAPQQLRATAAIAPGRIIGRA